MEGLRQEPRTTNINFTAELIIQTIEGLDNPDKQIQSQCNDLLQIYTEGRDTNFELIQKLFMTNVVKYQLFASNLLFSKLQHCYAKLSVSQVHELKDFISGLQNKLNQNLIILRSLAKSKAFLSLKSFLQNDLNFFASQNIQLESAEDCITRLLLFINISELLSAGILPLKETRFIENQIRESEESIVKWVLLVIENKAFHSLLLEFIENFCKMIDFLINFRFIYKICKNFIMEIHMARNELFENTVNCLSEIIRTSRFAEALETTSLDSYIVQNSLWIKQVSEAEDTQISDYTMNLDICLDSEQSILISLRFIIQTLQYLKLSKYKTYLALLSTILQSFPQFLLFSSAFFTSLFNEISEVVQKTDLHISKMFLAFEWLYPYIKIFGRESIRISFDVKEKIHMLIVGFIQRLITANQLSSNKVLEYFLASYSLTSAENSADEVLKFRENRSSLEELFNDLCSFWKILTESKFASQLQALSAYHLSMTNFSTEVLYCLNIESYFFFLKSSIDVITEDEDAIIVIKNIIEFIKTLNLSQYQFLKISCLSLINAISWHSESPEIDAFIINYALLIFEKRAFSFDDSLIIDAFGNSISRFKGFGVNATDLSIAICYVSDMVNEMSVSALSRIVFNKRVKLVDQIITSVIKFIGNNIEFGSPDIETLGSTFFAITSKMCQTLTCTNQKNLSEIYLNLILTILNNYGTDSNEVDISEKRMIFENSISNFIISHKEALFLMFDNFINENSSIRDLYFKVLRMIIKKFSDDEFGYFELIIIKSTVIISQNQSVDHNSNSLSLISRIISMNTENSKVEKWLNENYDKFEYYLLNILIQENQNTRVEKFRNEDFRLEYVYYQTIILNNFERKFFNFLAGTERLEAIGDSYELPGSIDLRKSLLRF
jgi:hypothetical protein